MGGAPGWPGSAAKWTSSAKWGGAAALSDTSRDWFTISHGIVNEVHYPRVDHACLRDLVLIVTDGDQFFAEEKRDCDCAISWLEEGVPAFLLTNTHREGRFHIVTKAIADPRSDSVRMHIRLQSLSGVNRSVNCG